MRLAVCAEMVFLDLPVTERVRRIAEAGFDAEIWDWTRHDIEALAATGAMFSSMTGYAAEEGHDVEFGLRMRAMEVAQQACGREPPADHVDAQRAAAGAHGGGGAHGIEVHAVPP